MRTVKTAAERRHPFFCSVKLETLEAIKKIASERGGSQGALIDELVAREVAGLARDESLVEFARGEVVTPEPVEVGA